MQKGNEAPHTQSKSEVIKYKLLTAIKAENPKKGRGERNKSGRKNCELCVASKASGVIVSRRSRLLMQKEETQQKPAQTFRVNFLSKFTRNFIVL